MSRNPRKKNLRGRFNGPEILEHFMSTYSVESNSRYKHIDLLQLADGNRILATLGPIDLGVFPFEGMKTHVVTKAEENRIDIIATKYYGSAALYWIICYLNRLPDPLTVPSGKVLFIPSVESLRQFPNPLS